MLNEVDPCDILEERIKALELKVFGETPESYDTTTDVVDMLTKSQNLTSSVISSHDKINKMVKRLDQLELILDPLYEDSLLDNATKIEIILQMENDIENTLTYLKEIENKSNVLESEQIRNIPKTEGRLNILLNNLLENKEKCEHVTQSVNDLLKHYNDVIINFTKTFAQLNDVVTDLEIQAELKKKVVDE